LLSTSSFICHKRCTYTSLNNALNFKPRLYSFVERDPDFRGIRGGWVGPRCVTFALEKRKTL
jgi:hypothetical protein